MRDRVSLSDVARVAGVSTATASRALSNAYGVAPGTRRRVVEAASELDYVVSPEASRLAMRRRASSRVRRIAVVLAPREALWWSSAAAAHDALTDAGHDVMLLPVAGVDAVNSVLERLVRDRTIDAAILVDVPVGPGARRRLEHAGLAVVTVGNVVDATADVRVCASACERLAVEHLVTSGHRKVARLRSLPAAHGNGAATHNAREGVSVRRGAAVVSIDVDATAAGIRSAIAGLVADVEPPTALWVESIDLAVASLTALRRDGYEVPGDVSVVALGEHHLAELVDLTTVSVRPADLGASAASLLVAGMRGEVPDYALHVLPSLVVRGSSGAPRTAQRIGHAARVGEPM